MDAEAEGFAQFVEARQRALQKIVFLVTQTAPKTGLKGSPTAATCSEHDLPDVQSPTGLAPHSLMGYHQVGAVLPGPAPSRNTTIRLPQLHARTNSLPVKA